MRNARGFSLVELVVVIVAIGIVTGALLDRVLPLIGRAQRTAFMQVKADGQTALLLAAAERITRGEAATLPALADENPMTLLLTPPANYVGSFAMPEERDVPPASWYFDERTRRLVYRVGRYARFDAQGGPQDRIELKTEFVYADLNRSGAFEAVGDEFQGLRLTPAHAFAWPE